MPSYPLEAKTGQPIYGTAEGKGYRKIRVGPRMQGLMADWAGKEDKCIGDPSKTGRGGCHQSAALSYHTSKARAASSKSSSYILTSLSRTSTSASISTTLSFS